MGYEEMAVQISGGKVNTYTQKHVFNYIFFFSSVYLLFFKTDMVKWT